MTFFQKENKLLNKKYNLFRICIISIQVKNEQKSPIGTEDKLFVEQLKSLRFAARIFNEIRSQFVKKGKNLQISKNNLVGEQKRYEIALIIK